jgi:hypothetical protein
MQYTDKRGTSKYWGWKHTQIILKPLDDISSKSKHYVKELHKTAVPGTTHLLRKTPILYQDTESHLRRITQEAASAVRGRGILFSVGKRIPLLN